MQSQNPVNIQFGPTSYTDLLNNAGTFSFQPTTNVIKMLYPNGDKVFLSTVTNGNIESLVIKGINSEKIIYNSSGYNEDTKSGVITFKKSTSNFSYNMSFVNGDLTDFNDPDVGARPCWSRSEFKAWYKMLKEDQSPEQDVWCDLVPPTCNVGHYIAAGILCCWYGTGPNIPASQKTIYIPLTIGE